MTNINFPYHLVEKRPWPLLISFNVLLLTLGFTKWFHTSLTSLINLALLRLLFSSYSWWQDVTRERTYQGLHTSKVLTNINLGIILFILSEIIFFFRFFWAFFHSRLSPTLELGYSWPPNFLNPFDPYTIPFLNTSILLASRITVTWTHHSLLSKDLISSLLRLVSTIILGLYFTLIQATEYLEASFSISDSSYGRVFFLATGFHGLHVIIGSLFLLSSLIRISIAHISPSHHFGLEASIWYWHFVDVVWLFLFTWIYWWGF